MRTLVCTGSLSHVVVIRVLSIENINFTTTFVNFYCFTCFIKFFGFYYFNIMVYYSVFS
jgi:hypothetical protein